MEQIVSTNERWILNDLPYVTCFDGLCVTHISNLGTRALPTAYGLRSTPARLTCGLFPSHERKAVEYGILGETSVWLPGTDSDYYSWQKDPWQTDTEHIKYVKPQRENFIRCLLFRVLLLAPGLALTFEDRLCCALFRRTELCLICLHKKNQMPLWHLSITRNKAVTHPNPLQSYLHLYSVRYTSLR